MSGLEAGIAVVALTVFALFLLGKMTRDLDAVREALISIHVELASLKERMDREEEQRWHLRNRLDACRWMIRDIRAEVQTLTGPESATPSETAEGGNGA